VFNLVPGSGEEVGEQLARHPGVDQVSFTGSTLVGWAAAKGEVVFRNATYRVHEADWVYFVERPAAILSGGTQRVLLLGDVVDSTVELIEPGWQFAFDEDRAAAAAMRQQISTELLDSQDVAAAADFLDPWFGRLVTAEASRHWIFM
jgi:hypothetical protein